VPGNLCNSYRIKPRGRQLIRGWRKGGGGWCNHKATDTHTDTHQHTYIFTWLWQSNPNPLHRSRPLAISIALRPTTFGILSSFTFIFYLSVFFLFFGTKTTKLHWVGAAAGGIGPKPKAESPIPISTYRRLWSC